MKHKLLLLYAWLIWLVTFFLPDIPFIMRFRGFLYGIAMKRCGENLQVSSSVIFKNLENCSFGRDVYLAPNVVINAISAVTLEDEVMIGFNSVLVSGNHSVFNNSYRFGASIKTPIFIGKGTWVGANCTLTAGASLLECNILAANSVLSKPVVGSSKVFGGVPAKLIKSPEPE